MKKITTSILACLFVLVLSVSLVAAVDVEVASDCRLEGRSWSFWSGWKSWTPTTNCNMFSQCRINCDSVVVTDASDCYNKSEVEGLIGVSGEALMSDVDLIYYNMSEIDSFLVEIGDALDEMNHGTLNLFHQFDYDRLHVWGEAPVDAVKVRVCMKGGVSIGAAELDRDNNCIGEKKLGVNEDNFYRTTFYPLSDFDDDMYNVVVFFYESNTDYLNYNPISQATVSAPFLGLYLEKLKGDIEDLELNLSVLSDDLVEAENDIEELQVRFDELNVSLNDLYDIVENLGIEDIDGLQDALDGLQGQIDDINSEIDDIWFMLADMNHGTVNLFHVLNVDDNKLRVWGEAPEGAKRVKVRFCPFGVEPTTCRKNGIYVGADVVVKVGGDNAHWYNSWTDLSGYDNGMYNIYSTFYDNNGKWMNGFNTGAIFTGLSGFGFTDVDMDSQIATYLSNNVWGEIRYDVVLDETLASGTVRVLSTDGSINQTLRTQSFFAGDVYHLGDDIEFDALGEYELYLVIDGTDWMSYAVNTSVVDIAPTSDITIVSPTVNNGGVYWFNPDFVSEVVLEAIVLASTEEEMYSYVVDGIGSTRTFMDEWNVNGTDMTGVVFDSFDFEEERVYDLTVDATLGHGSDNILVGVDWTAPVIYDIVPYSGAYAGTMFVFVNASDEASGIESVWIDLIAKDNASIVYTLEGELNSSTGFYEAEFDSLAMNISDGNYNISVVATDYAGNSVSGLVDPIIDNSAPLIMAPFINDVYTDDYLMRIGAEIIDVPAGLDYAYALLSGANGLVDERIDLICDANDNCMGSFADSTFVSGEYSLMIFAYDNAGNSRTLSHTENVSVGARPIVVIPSKKKSSGSGGSAADEDPLKVCGVENWDCSLWSTCGESGVQFRTCDMIGECEANESAFIPTLSQSCIFIAEEEPAVEESVAETVEDDAPKPGFLAAITGAVIGGGAASWIVGVFIVLILGLTIVVIYKRRI